MPGKLGAAAAVAHPPPDCIATSGRNIDCNGQTLQVCGGASDSCIEKGIWDGSPEYHVASG